MSNPHANLRRLVELGKLVLAKARRPSEPDAAAKLAAERKLARVLADYFDRLQRKAVARLNAHPPQQRAAKAAYLDDTFDDEFWRDDKALEALAAVLALTSRIGALSLRALVNLDIDLTAFNREAAQAARDYAYDLIKDLTATARDALQTVISDFVTTPGMTLGDVIERLPFNEQRAALIATTEITRAYATGQAAAGAALKEQFPGVRVVKEWFTSNDDHVCPICGPLDGQEVDDGEQFDGEFDEPPAHPGCRCWISYRTRI